MPPPRLPTDLVVRFARDLDRLAAGRPERLGVAVSGGADSIALLLLAVAALPARVEAATVDHGLRPESASEALHVGRISAEIGCPHTIIPVTVADSPAGLQAEARRMRYDALGAWAAERGIVHLATAHHADDQAETVLMRLRRGSGVAGLGGIRPARTDGDLLILRPLLDWTKADLVRLVAAEGVAFIDDPSNRDSRFDRVAMRRFLAETDLFDPRRLARSAAACREADEALACWADRLAEERITIVDGEWHVATAGLPRELKRRLLNRALAAARRSHGLQPPWTGAEDVEVLLATLDAGGTGTLAGMVARGGETWRLRPAPPRRQVRERR